MKLLQEKKTKIPPKDWELKKLEKITKQISDGTHATPKYVENGIDFYSVESVTNDDFTNVKKITLDEHKQISKRCLVEKGDILMTRIGTLGETKLIDWDVDASIYVSLALIKVKDEISKEYLYQYTKGHNFKKELLRRSLLRATPQKINIGDIKKIPILIPENIMEQQKIAKILSTWDKAIELKEKLIEQKKEQKKGLMQKLLTGEVRLPGFKGEWKEVKLSKICTLETGKRPKGGVTTKGEIPSLGGENIYSDNGLNLTTIKKVNLEFYESMTKGQLKENDILINKDGAQTGKVALYKDSGLEKACINEHLFIVRTTKNISYKFLYYYLGSEEGQQKMKVRITSSAQPGLNSQFVKGFTLRIPVYEEQKLIGDILFSLDKELLLLKDEKMLLEKQKKGLMQLLLTGKVRVKV